MHTWVTEWDQWLHSVKQKWVHSVYLHTADLESFYIDLVVKPFLIECVPDVKSALVEYGNTQSLEHPLQLSYVGQLLVEYTPSVAQMDKMERTFEGRIAWPAFAEAFSVKPYTAPAVPRNPLKPLKFARILIRYNFSDKFLTFFRKELRAEEIHLDRNNQGFYLHPVLYKDYMMHDSAVDYIANASNGSAEVFWGDITMYMKIYTNKRCCICKKDATRVARCTVIQSIT
jgi:hypothetical protein